MNEPVGCMKDNILLNILFTLQPTTAEKQERERIFDSQNVSLPSGDSGLH